LKRSHTFVIRASGIQSFLGTYFQPNDFKL
jgi:hypothetical protein